MRAPAPSAARRHVAAHVLLAVFLLAHQLAPVAHLATYRPDHTHGPEVAGPEPDGHHDDDDDDDDDHDVDHGTDLAVSVAGMPVNLPTHGHGQGYADMNFLIPELVSGIQYRKGTSSAESGDFSAAGAVRVSYLNVLDAPLARVEAGAYGYARALERPGALQPGHGHHRRRRRMATRPG